MLAGLWGFQQWVVMHIVGFSFLWKHLTCLYIYIYIYIHVYIYTCTYPQRAPRKLSQGRIILGTRMRPRTYQSFPNVASFRVQRHFRDHEKRPFGCSKLQWQRVECVMVPAENCWDVFIWKKIMWVWIKIRYPNHWMVNTKLDIHICGPLGLGLPFWPTSMWFSQHACGPSPSHQHV